MVCFIVLFLKLKNPLLNGLPNLSGRVYQRWVVIEHHSVHGQIRSHHLETMVATITFAGIYVAESTQKPWFLISVVPDNGFRIHSMMNFGMCPTPAMPIVWILHQFETMFETITWVFAGDKSFQGFLGSCARRGCRHHPTLAFAQPQPFYLSGSEG